MKPIKTMLRGLETGQQLQLDAGNKIMLATTMKTKMKVAVMAKRRMTTRTEMAAIAEAIFSHSQMLARAVLVPRSPKILPLMSMLKKTTLEKVTKVKRMKKTKQVRKGRKVQRELRR